MKQNANGKTYMIVFSNNIVGLDSRSVGRIDRASYQFSSGQNCRTTFFTASDPAVRVYDLPHEIDEPLYIGGPSDWKINPGFEAAVREIVGQAA